jgi:hypothetical protein
MNPTTHARSIRSLTLFGILIVLTGIFLLFNVSHALAGKADKMDRQIRVAERCLDEMLLDSPDWLFPGIGNARGVYLPGTGAIFTFTATLTDYNWGGHDGFSFFGSHFNWGGHRSRHVIIRRTDPDDEDSDVEVQIKKDKSDDDDEWVFDEKNYEKRMQRKYDRGKDDLMGALLDFGDILKAVPNGETVVVEGRLHDIELPSGKEIAKLTMTAKIDDLRALAAGTLKESDLRSRIVVTEEEE